MNYTAKKVAQLSGITVRTLHFYDEIGLLKPSFVAENGYRYYQEKELIRLQQILFFRELGFELKKIQEIIVQDDFDTIHALHSHKHVLEKNITRLKTLIKTIDTTITYLEEKQPMNEHTLFNGFDKEKQAEHEKQLINKYGDTVKDHITESKNKIKHWTKTDWDKRGAEFDSICKELTSLLEKKYKPNAPEVQTIIKRHYEWIKNFWTPNKESYAGLGQVYASPEWQTRFIPYHEKLGQFFADAMQVFASNTLSSVDSL